MSHICLWLCAGLSVCCCSWADKITGKVLPTDTPHHAYTLIEPLGVVAAVSASTGWRRLLSDREYVVT
jgi:acyl-CoA reductase-like NAD-dependent aldehyde dehydrogenase